MTQWASICTATGAISASRLPRSAATAAHAAHPSTFPPHRGRPGAAGRGTSRWGVVLPEDAAAVEHLHGVALADVDPETHPGLTAPWLPSTTGNPGQPAH